MKNEAGHSHHSHSTSEHIVLLKPVWAPMEVWQGRQNSIFQGCA